MLAIGIHAARTPEHAAALGGLLVPIAALGVARLAPSEPRRRAAAALLVLLAVGRAAMQGSQAAAALHDPLFWAVVTAVTCGVAACTGRWPMIAVAAAAVSGATAVVATVLPVFPDFATVFPRLTAVKVSTGFRVLVDQFGIVATICLVFLSLYALAGRLGTPARLNRTAAAARSALLAAILLAAAGAIPGDGLTVASLLALGILLGLARPWTTHPRLEQSSIPDNTAS
jgi:hypothetical protein